jgi:UDP-3-O-[3-hydroxymyristoyl] N-acetylglucosamine deacetylase/3-hydroxyacyl-[acyl-carrier-protein] dehydratase
MSGANGRDTTLQRTIVGTVTLEGYGLHTGEPVQTTLRPAAENTGILFRRVDIEGQPEIPGLVEYVTGVEWETVLGPDEACVRTVEHLLAAIAAAGIDNIDIDMIGPEPPAFDGSSAKWCEVFRELGTEEQGAPAPSLAIDSPFFLKSGDSRYAVMPYPGYRISAEIEFENPAIGRQFASLQVDEPTFYREVAGARTFGLEAWQESLQSRGLALGATEDNTILVTDEGIAPDAKLRYPDEFVRHKVIDLIGDLALVGARLQCHVVAERPGHRGNVEVARRLRSLVDAGGEAEQRLDIQDILAHIPHRYPFLLVDRILEFEAGERILGLKNVTINEPFFAGHFPDHPIMPGVLIVEAMAQVGGMLLMNEFEEPRDKVVYFMSLDDVKFRRPVTPGDQLQFEVELLQFRGRVCKMRGVARVDGDRAAEATMMAQVVDR